MSKLWPRAMFVAIFLVSLLWQWGTWQRYVFIDSDFWVVRTAHLAHDIVRGPLYFTKARYAEHPGLPPMLGATALHVLGLSIEDSLRISVVILQALLITIAIILAYKLKPDTWWAFTVAGMLWLYRLYENSNPADTIMFTLTIIIGLLLLWHWERSSTPLKISCMLGIAFGVALATRIHLAIPLVGISVLALAIFFDLKRAFFIGVVALVSCYAFNPFLWYAPALYVRPALFGQFWYVTTMNTTATPMALGDIMRYSPLSFLTIAWALIVLFVRKLTSPLPRRFLIVLLAVSTFWLVLLFISRIESRRYYYPLVALWEILFPLFVFEASKTIAMKKGLQTRGQNIMNLITQGLIIVYTTHLFL